MRRLTPRPYAVHSWAGELAVDDCYAETPIVTRYGRAWLPTNTEEMLARQELLERAQEAHAGEERELARTLAKLEEAAAAARATGAADTAAELARCAQLLPSVVARPVATMALANALVAMEATAATRVALDLIVARLAPFRGPSGNGFGAVTP